MWKVGGKHAQKYLTTSSNPITDQHLITRYKEHRDRSAQPVAMHFAGCGLVVKEEDIVILASTKKSMPHLYTLEVLFVRELKYFTQLKDDFQ